MVHGLDRTGHRSCWEQRLYAGCTLAARLRSWRRPPRAPRVALATVVRGGSHAQVRCVARVRFGCVCLVLVAPASPTDGRSGRGSGRTRSGRAATGRRRGGDAAVRARWGLQPSLRRGQLRVRVPRGQHVQRVVQRRKLPADLRGRRDLQQLVRWRQLLDVVRGWRDLRYLVRRRQLPAHVWAQRDVQRLVRRRQLQRDVARSPARVG